MVVDGKQEYAKIIEIPANQHQAETKNLVYFILSVVKEHLKYK